MAGIREQSANSGMDELEGERNGPGNDHVEETRLTKSAIVFAACAAINSINLGYDIGISTSAGKLVQEDMGLSLTARELFVGSLNFWAIFGALVSQISSDRYGRRQTFSLAAIGFISGCTVMALASNYSLLMIGRVFVGIGVGTGLAIDPLYIAEITPAKYRGEMVTWSEIALNGGIVLGFTMRLILVPLADSTEWRAMFLAGCILPAVMLYLVKDVMPESPRWLVAKGRIDEAKRVFKKIYPAHVDIDTIIKEVQESMERESAAQTSTDWRTLLCPTPAIRRMLVVGIGIAISQQLVGIDAIQYYLLDVIEETGIDDTTRETLVLIALGIVKLTFIIIGGKLFDRRGRRPLLFVSLLGMALALLVISMTFLLSPQESKAIIICGLAFYLAFFSLGMGPGAWLVASECFATGIRAKAMAMATFSNRIAATLMSSSFLSLAKAMGWGGFFLVLVTICLLVFMFVYFLLPETKGKSLEEMSIYFAEITGDTAVLDGEKPRQGDFEDIEMTDMNDQKKIPAVV